MLKPYACVACEKVILSKDNEVPSLISLFSKIIVTAPAGAEIPRNAAGPREWAVFSMWFAEPEDENRDYVLCTQLLYPDQTQFAEIHKLRVPVERNKRSQMLVQFNGFPLGQTGIYTVRTWIEEREQSVVGPIDIPIELEIIRQGLAQPAQRG
jgi:hypothetical protein